MSPIKSAQLFTSIGTSKVLPNSDLDKNKYPLFAFIGRSNVGKSSFINSITGVKDLCRSGASPGVTKTVNLFLVNNKILFADLPGYGYAKMSIPERKKLEDLIFWYLGNPENSFNQIFLLVDGKIGPQPSDLEVLQFLNQKQLPTTIIATKFDRLKSSEKAGALKKITSQIRNHNVIAYSSVTGEGRQDVYKTLELN